MKSRFLTTMAITSIFWMLLVMYPPYDGISALSGAQASANSLEWFELLDERTLFNTHCDWRLDLKMLAIEGGAALLLAALLANRLCPRPRKSDAVQDACFA